MKVVKYWEMGCWFSSLDGKYRVCLFSFMRNLNWTRLHDFDLCSYWKNDPKLDTSGKKKHSESKLQPLSAKSNHSCSHPKMQPCCLSSPVLSSHDSPVPPASHAHVRSVSAKLQLRWQSRRIASLLWLDTMLVSH